MPIDFNVGSEQFTAVNSHQLIRGKNYLIKNRVPGEVGSGRMDYIGKFEYKLSTYNYFKILYYRKPREGDHQARNRWVKFNNREDNTYLFSAKNGVFDLGEAGKLISDEVSPDQAAVLANQEPTPDTSSGGKKYLGIKRKGKRKTNRKTKRNYKNTKKNRKQYKR